MTLDRWLAELGWRPQRRVSKFIAYFQLLEACDKPGCPVCRCLRELTFRSLDGLLYEQVTDPGTRAVFTQSWGFCSWHAWMATEVRNAALGMAILYQDLLSQLHARLSAAHRELNRSSSVGGWRRLFRRRAPVGLVQARARRTGCPLCFAALQGVELEAVVKPGHEVETIVTYAKEGGFDLLVIGFVGYSNIWSRIMGSTTQSLSRLAPCSVMIVK